MNWDSLWLNVNIATMANDGDLGVIKNAALGVKDGKIAWLGPEKNLPHGNANTIHQLDGQWITPGLIDCHTHLIYAGNRANEFALRLQGKSYQDITKAGGGILATVKATREASFEDLYHQSKQRLLALIQEGVTTVEIKSGYGLDLETEIKMLQVAKKLEQDLPVTIQKTYLGAHTIPPEFHHADDYIDFICEEVLPLIAKDNLADSVDGFCETIAFNPQQIEKVFQQSQSLNLPVKCHAEQLSDLNGASLAAKYQALSADHLEYANENSIKQMAKAKTTAVLLPGAYYFIQETKKPPIDLLRRHHVPMAIATDCNPGTSPISSLLLIANMACVLFQLSPVEALKGITINAAKALGLEMNYGSLEINKIADFVIWNIENPMDLIYYMGPKLEKQRIKEGNLID